MTISNNINKVKATYQDISSSISSGQKTNATAAQKNLKNKLELESKQNDVKSRSVQIKKDNLHSLKNTVSQMQSAMSKLGQINQEQSDTAVSEEQKILLNMQKDSIQLGYQNTLDSIKLGNQSLTTSSVADTSSSNLGKNIDPARDGSFEVKSASKAGYYRVSLNEDRTLITLHMLNGSNEKETVPYIGSNNVYEFSIGGGVLIDGIKDVVAETPVYVHSLREMGMIQNNMFDVHFTPTHISNRMDGIHGYSSVVLNRNDMTQSSFTIDGYTTIFDATQLEQQITLTNSNGDIITGVLEASAGYYNDNPLTADAIQLIEDYGFSNRSYYSVTNNSIISNIPYDLSSNTNKTLVNGLTMNASIQSDSRSDQSNKTLDINGTLHSVRLSIDDFISGSINFNNHTTGSITLANSNGDTIVIDLNVNREEIYDRYQHSTYRQAIFRKILKIDFQISNLKIYNRSPTYEYQRMFVEMVNQINEAYNTEGPDSDAYISIRAKSAFWINGTYDNATINVGDFITQEPVDMTKWNYNVNGENYLLGEVTLYNSEGDVMTMSLKTRLYHFRTQQSFGPEDGLDSDFINIGGNSINHFTYSAGPSQIAPDGIGIIGDKLTVEANIAKAEGDISISNTQLQFRGSGANTELSLGQFKGMANLETDGEHLIQLTDGRGNNIDIRLNINIENYDPKAVISESIDLSNQIDNMFLVKRQSNGVVPNATVDIDNLIQSVPAIKDILDPNVRSDIEKIINALQTEENKIFAEEDNMTKLLDLYMQSSTRSKETSQDVIKNDSVHDNMMLKNMLTQLGNILTSMEFISDEENTIERFIKNG